MSGPSTTLHLINGQAVRDLLPMDTCIALMRQAFTQVSEGRAAQPIRAMVRTTDGKGVMGWMPGFTEEPRRLGLKAVAIFPEAVAQGLKSHQGMVLLFEAVTGQPIAVVDAAEITGIRTAAATGAATEALARPDARTFSIFGLGEQAHTHLKAMGALKRFERCQVWGRDAAKTRAFVEREAAGYDFAMEAVETPEAAAGADVLCLVSGAPEPYFRGAWLKPGQHVNVVGSSIPTTSEIDHDTIIRSRVFVDYKASALALAGDLRRALEAGVIREDHILGEVGDVLLGRVPGRRSAQDITLFKSLGMVAEDLISADFVVEEAKRRGAGAVVDW
jgi:ornithine cyclodeaminase